MRNIFVISVFSCIFALSATAQNLDPTVEVSREYEGKLVEVHKPVFDMAVPDSVTRFALDFDYSVFDNPYKGSYEFSPYLLSMKPSASDSGESRFYLRAGAGYQPHPTVDLVWSPGFKRPGFNMDVYGQHRSYIGNYHTISPVVQESGEILMTKGPVMEDGSHKWHGVDMVNKAGVVFKHDWESLSLDYSAGYYGMSVHTPSLKGTDYNVVDAGLSLKTKPESLESLVFGMELDYRYGVNSANSSPMRENVGRAKMHVGPFMVNNHRMGLGFEANYASYTGHYLLSGGDVSLNPGYLFHKDRFSVSLGARILKMLTDEDVNEQYIYPDVSLSYVLLPNSLKLYFDAKGGGRYETYSSIMESDHFLGNLLSSMLGYEIERVGLTLGFDGRVTDKFSYNLRGGYSNYAGLRHYVMVPYETDWYTYMTHFATQKWYAAIDWALDVENFRFDGSVSYDHFWSDSNLYSEPDKYGLFVLKPAALTGNVAVEYNWKKRLVCGLDCDFAGAMKGVGAEVPGYADLGVSAEYATARNISLWMRAGNLLNQTVQRSPLYAEKGVHFTLGICMNL